MAKKTTVEIVETKKVKFTKTFEGNLNDFSIKVTKLDIARGETLRELPLNVYSWIQKYKVCKDA